MKTHHQYLQVIFLFVTTLVLVGCSEKFAFDDNSALAFNLEKYDIADELRGGRLYDTWWLEKDSTTPPSGINPIWQEIAVDSKGVPINKYGNGGGQWRCKECHGWDYKGTQGAYSITSDRYTGFKGLKNSNTSYTKEFIFTKIAKGEVEVDGKKYSHQFYNTTEKLNEQDLYDLTRFIFEVVVNDNADPSLGTIDTGQQIYETSTPTRLSCANTGCHQSTEQLIIFIAQSNKEKFLHKVRFGSPGSLMPAGLITSDAQDLWAYTNAGARNIHIPTSNFDSEIYATLTKTDVEKGAQLYDRWWLSAVETNEPGETETHPLWPASNTSFTGPETWRCASCHGWDYQGRDGAFKNGAYATGIIGVVPTENTYVLMESADNVYSYLKETEAHSFNNQFFSDTEYYALTKFIMTMRDEVLSRNDLTQSINPESRYALNYNSVTGKTLYEDGQTQCSSCHGLDGKTIDFIDANDATSPNKFIEESALENPWAFIHAIRFGKPSTTMNGLYSNEDFSLSSLQSAINILAYSQHSIDSNITRGALLYDQWWSTRGVKTTTAPQFRNKQWITSSGSADTSLLSDNDTWRCSACHGWDYDGSQGELSNTDHKYYSNQAGFYELDTMLNDKTSIISSISNGIAGVQDHTFSKYLSIEDIDDIVNFILDGNQGVPASQSVYLQATQNGNSASGLLLYENSCIACHGENGTKLPRVDLGYLSTTFTTSVIHTVQFGHPGSNMVQQLGNYQKHTLDEASDITQYSKTFEAAASYATASLFRGARLYEDWFKEKEVTIPANLPIDANPLWDDARGTIPDEVSETWHCSRCHGWDYLGNVPESNDNLADTIASLKLTLNDEEQQNRIFNRLKEQLENHNFSASNSSLPIPLDDRDMWDLTRFILDGGIIDLRDSIQNGSLITEANSDNGKGLYLGSIDQKIDCAACHGYYGNKSLSEEHGDTSSELDVFRTASAFKFPYRSLHYIRFGKAGTSMGGIEDGTITSDNALNVLDYMQQRYIDR